MLHINYYLRSKYAKIISVCIMYMSHDGNGMKGKLVRKP